MDCVIGWTGRLCISFGLAALCLSPLFTPTQQAWAGSQGTVGGPCQQTCFPTNPTPPCVNNCPGTCNPVWQGWVCTTCLNSTIAWPGGQFTCSCDCIGSQSTP
jgi:hypothetical protein